MIDQQKTRNANAAGFVVWVASTQRTPISSSKTN